MFVLLVIVALSSLIIYWYKFHNHFNKYIKKFPGPKPLPVIGNAHQMGTRPDPLQKMIELEKTYGKMYKMCLGFLPPSLFISDLEMVEHVLSSNTILDKADSYKFLTKWLGDGLLTSTGDKWRKHRKMLTPAFHFKILEQFINVFNLFGNVLTLQLEKEIGKNSFDIFLPISLCTLDVICATSMGTNVDAQQTNSDYVNAVKNISKIIINRTGSALKSVDFLYYFTFDRLRENKLLRLLHNFTERVISKRRQQLLNNVDVDTSSDNLGIKKKLTFLDLMLECQLSKNIISDKAIREEVDTFMFEGHDTTACGISFILYCLANNRDVQMGTRPGNDFRFYKHESYLYGDLDPLQKMIELEKTYGKMYKMCLGFLPPSLFISDLEMVEHVLSSNTILDKADSYKFLTKWLGDGLLTSTGDKWRKHRKMLTPAFHFKILEQFINVFNLFGNVLTLQLEKEIGKKSFDIFLPISLCTLDVICATSMGTNVDAQQTNSDYVNAVKNISKIIINRTGSALKSVDFLYYFTFDHLRENKLLRLLHNFTERVISKRRQQLLNNVDVDTSSDNLGIKKKLTFLDLMLECQLSKNIISDKAIREEVDTFMFEGHDTTACGISFILYCLANNRDVQEKVIEELQEIIGDKNEKITYQHLQSLKYLEMVIKESLRLYPPVPFFGRSLSENTLINGTMLPKGLTLLIIAFNLHRDPDVYPNPEQFIPERFSQEIQSKRSPYAYIPFSAGPRNCIGQKFAMLEMKSIVSKVLMNFELLPATPKHTPILAGHLILKSENGICISVKKRNLNKS
ncbi:hypothetical protein FQR65_LT11017 [Abscondita terminalis]|nr:hypothetical protein FQR65_LT11017 [Abscondita terminalis]